MTSLLEASPSDYTEILRGPLPSVPEGAVIDGRFKVIGELHRDSEGCKSVVFQAEDQEHDTEAAVKVVRVPDLAITASFAAETAVAKDLSQSTPGAVEVLDEGISEASGQVFPYIAMKRERGTLESERKKLKGMRFGVEQLLGGLKPAVETLRYMHDKGIVHGDIKPSNFLWDEEEGIFRLSDYGNVNLEHCDPEYLQNRGISQEVVELIRPEPGKVFGSSGYIAPELLALRTDHTKESDMYAFGVTLFHSLLDRAPGVATASQIGVQRGDYSIEEPHKIRTDVPREFGEFMMACVAKVPESRATIQDADDVFDAALQEIRARSTAESREQVAA